MSDTKTSSSVSYPDSLNWVCECGKRLAEHPAQPPWWPCMLKRTSGVVKNIEDVLNAAQKVCKIYYEIAAEVLGEDEVRRRRDARIAQDIEQQKV